MLFFEPFFQMPNCNPFSIKRAAKKMKMVEDSALGDLRKKLAYVIFCRTFIIYCYFIFMEENFQVDYKLFHCRKRRQSIYPDEDPSSDNSADEWSDTSTTVNKKDATTLNKVPSQKGEQGNVYETPEYVCYEYGFNEYFNHNFHLYYSLRFTDRHQRIINMKEKKTEYDAKVLQKSNTTKNEPGLEQNDSNSLKYAF